MKEGELFILRVSNVVTTDEIKKWRPGDIITIQAPTGAGKSYFIKNILYAIAKKDNKKILMLIHRLNCIEQFQYEIEEDNKTDIIHLKTYQSIEAYLKSGESFIFMITITSFVMSFIILCLMLLLINLLICHLMPF